MSTRNKSFYFLVGALVAIFLFHGYIQATFLRGPSGHPPISYDYSLPTKYGRAITVARVIDGDTVELMNGDRLRYIGIDTPEEVDPRKPTQCFAQEAAEVNKRLVEGSPIIFYKDVSSHDQYGRWLGFVYLQDGTFVNLVLVQEGLAFAYPYPPDTSQAYRFKEAETEARKAKRGLWAKCQVFLMNGREQTNNL